MVWKTIDRLQQINEVGAVFQGLTFCQSLHLHVGEIGTFPGDGREDRLEVFPQSDTAIHVLADFDFEDLLVDVRGAGFQALQWVNNFESLTL